MTAWVKATTLGRSKTVDVLLLHGLFANSAFWIPYLGYLSQCRVTLVDIDYPAMFASGAPLQALCAAVEALAGSAPAHVVGHSFGCCVAVGLQGSFASRSLICPTFAATSFDQARFCADIAGLAGPTPTATAVVEMALRHKAHCALELAYRPGDALYLAHDDPYFRYSAPNGAPAVHEVGGGHFAIGAAVAAIARSKLGYTDSAAADG